MNDIITDLLAIIGVVLNGLPQGLLDRIQLVKLYPQGNAEARFKMNGVKKIYFYCNHSGLYYRDLMKGIDDRTVSIVASMDEEKYISNFASADFTIADGSLKNYSLSESSTDSVSFEDMKKFNSISGVEESGAIYMSESMQNMKGTPYERLVKLYETHPEWFTHGLPKRNILPQLSTGRSLSTHIFME